MNPFYRLGQRTALEKLSGERVSVLRNGDSGYETPQQQAKTLGPFSPTSTNVSSQWDQFDRRTQNPMETSLTGSTNIGGV